METQALGMVKKNVLPRPSMLSTQILPWCASTYAVQWIAQAGAAAGARFIHTIETFKDTRDILRRNPNARILNPKADAIRGGLCQKNHLATTDA